MPESPRKLVEDVLTPYMTKEMWTVNCTEVLPFTLQDFSVGALLPAVLYMFRWGHRRGAGKFQETFAQSKYNKPTIGQVAARLATEKDFFIGFDGEVEAALLGDLLLSHCLENIGHRPGRDQQVQRVLPAHYMASWIDLPDKIAHLRFVPEMLVALLAEQKKGEVVERAAPGGSWFSVAAKIEDNLLLKLFARGIRVEGLASNLTSDRFDETAPLGIDELLMVRLAQACGEAPQKLTPGRARATGPNRGFVPISNQRPIAHRAARFFNEDLRKFIASYGLSVPRHTLLPMIESCIGLGLTNLLLSTTRMLFEWEATGHLPENHAEQPWPVLVDCACGADRSIRRVVEESMDDCTRRLRRLPVILMCIRILGFKVRNDPRLKNTLPDRCPDATDWLNLLGEVLRGRHVQSDRILDDCAEKCSALAERLEQDGHDVGIVDILRTERYANAAWRLAEALTLLMGDKLQGAQIQKCLDNCLMIDEQNGLARKRRVALRVAATGRRTGEMRTVVLSNTMLDFLVHRHLRSGAHDGGTTRPRILSLAGFIEILRERYGLHVDQPPTGLSVPKEMLLVNRQALERRLRDLGLLVGVNDAEAMKRLRQRFPAAGDDDNGV